MALQNRADKPLPVETILQIIYVNVYSVTVYTISYSLFLLAKRPSRKVGNLINISTYE